MIENSAECEVIHFLNAKNTRPGVRVVEWSVHSLPKPGIVDSIPPQDGLLHGVCQSLGSPNPNWYLASSAGGVKGHLWLVLTIVCYLWLK